ncbi:probable serine/threonine-protein kinase kinX [Sabethes cyaneus]|uniref:probable serine/threonine-protein kinase kinX n=1 Tax=Sabethes cyaneus TaxID=53552 RepID=UPI00237D8104|nr:probable serine/threonine-protein kinase kinX [Sabethes cyaneus]
MCRVVMLILTIVIGLCQARTVPIRGKQVKAYAYVLPAGAEEIRDDINHSFVCANRTDGFYVDIDNDCQIFHRCQDRARFSFICAEKTVFSQMYQTCVHEGQLGFPCEDSGAFYPDGEDSSVNSNDNDNDDGDGGKLSLPSGDNSEIEMPSQDLLPPEESIQHQADEPVIGTISMPISDNFVSEFDHHQLNADTFDPVEDNESENTAQEVTDEEAVSPPLEELHQDEAVTTSDTTKEEEVSEEITNVVSSDSENGHTSDEHIEEAVAVEALGTNEVSMNEHDNHENENTLLAEDAKVEPQSLLQNDVQIVEETDPVVQDVKVVEPETAISTDTNEEAPSGDITELKPLDSEISNDSSINAVAPETSNNSAEYVQQPNSDNVISEIALHEGNSEESQHEVSEPLPVESHANAAASVPIADSNQPEINEQSLPPAAVLPEATTNEIHPFVAATLADQLANESKNIDLPEFIVSTVADLRKGIPSLPLRRRRTFLFKADAMSS